MTNKPQNQVNVEELGELEKIIDELDRLTSDEFSIVLERYTLAYADNLGVRMQDKILQAIQSLLKQAQHRGFISGLTQARYATTPGSDEEKRIDNQLRAEMENNKGMGGYYWNIEKGLSGKPMSEHTECNNLCEPGNLRHFIATKQNNKDRKEEL